MRKPEHEQLTVAVVSGGDSRVDVVSISGPIKIQGSYLFTSGLGGVDNTAVQTSAISTAHFPRLGHGRNFFSPLDLLAYGIDPIVPAYPTVGQHWSSSSHDRSVYGASASSKVVGYRSVGTPAGRFRALVVQTKLNQPGHPFGSGTRLSYFAPGVGLVKLVFHHADGSTTTVTRL
jgi:hypothetical protein